MPKHAKAPGFNDRLRKSRNRLDLTAAEMARRMGIDYGCYIGWERPTPRGTVPAGITLKQAARSLGVKGWERFFLWLLDGQGDPPSWLEDKNADPWGATVPPAESVQAADLARLDAGEIRPLRAAAAVAGAPSPGPAIRKDDVRKPLGEVSSWLKLLERKAGDPFARATAEECRKTLDYLLSRLSSSEDGEYLLKWLFSRVYMRHGVGA